MKKSFKRMMSIILALMLLFSSASAVETISSVTVEAAELSSSQDSLDGMVRVYLSSLGSPTSLTLTISGSYSLSNGTSLTSGESITVSMNSSTGALTVTRSGSTTSMGTSFSIRRHSTSDTNGIKIAEARKPSNLYPGDIEFQAVAQSSGGYKLYTIVNVYIEDYLYGVVPYEMGSSAPLEALKAQAVAARTYTVRMMSYRSSAIYDVVDTTSDQTYNGTPTTTSRCNTAVDETKGIVLKNGSSYTATYYSASNGGQTESIYNAWGTSGYSYLGVKDDPFDYANPDSVVKSTTIYADATSSSNNSSLISLLKTKAISALKSEGYNATSTNTTIKTIQSIEPHTAKYSSPSRVYTKMDFTLTVSTYNSSGSSVSVTTTVTCDIFDELESLLSMSIQSSDNELWTVEESGSKFTLEARRYGHGIGMSQRGAMYMGELGYTYDEILGFYYPDSTRVGCVFSNTILAADSSEEITTEEEPVESDDSTCRGTVSISSSSIAIRYAKSTTADVLCLLSNGSSVNVLCDDGTWCLVSFGNIIGYLPTSSLTITGTPAETNDSTPTEIDGFAVVTASGYLNLRESGSYSAGILSTAASGSIFTVLSWGDTWSYIQYGTIVAYAASDYLTLYDEYPDDVPETEVEESEADTEDDSEDSDETDEEDEDDEDDDDSSDAVTAVVSTETGSLNMRTLAQAGSTILTTIPKGSTVTVTNKGETWSAVTYSGISGYVMTVFLSFDDEDDTDDDEDSDTETEDLQAVVTTVSGSLNLRSQAKIGSSIYCTIPQYSVITVHTKGTEWCYVTYSEITGYVMTAFLTFLSSDDTTEEDETEDDEEETEEDSDDDEETITAIVTTGSGSLNLRESAQSGSSVLTRIPNGTTIVVLQKLTSWTYTYYNNIYGYVMNDYLTFSDSSSNELLEDPLTATVTTSSGSLNMRDEPYGDVLMQIPQYASVDVYLKGSAWCYLCYDEIYGYVMTIYLTFDETEEDDSEDDDTVEDEEDSEETEEGTDDEESTEENTDTDEVIDLSSVTVDVSSGSLNLRVTKSTDAEILTTIADGTAVTILSYGSEWCKIQFGALQGYVQTEYLAFGSDDDGESEEEDTVSDEEESAEEETEDETDSSEYEYGTAWVYTSSGSLNMRDSASTDGTILLQIERLSQVTILITIDDTWCMINYEGETGYVMSAYLTTTDPTGEDDTDEEDTDTSDDSNDDDEAEETEENDAETSSDDIIEDSTLYTPDEEIYVYVRPPAGYSTLTLYEECSEDSEALVNMIENTEVEVVRVGVTWCEVVYYELQGFCLRDGLSFIDE